MVWTFDFFKKNLFIYLWLCWVFVSVRGLSLVAASGGHTSSRCAGLSLSRPLLLRSTGSRRAGSVVVAQGPSCSAACGIFPDQGSNPCPLHWQADSQTLRHQGSPEGRFFIGTILQIKKLRNREVRGFPSINKWRLHCLHSCQARNQEDVTDTLPIAATSLSTHHQSVACQEPGGTAGGEWRRSEGSFICVYSCSPSLALPPELRLLSALC